MDVGRRSGVASVDPRHHGGRRSLGRGACGDGGEPGVLDRERDCRPVVVRCPTPPPATRRRSRGYWRYSRDVGRCTAETVATSRRSMCALLTSGTTDSGSSHEGELSMPDSHGCTIDAAPCGPFLARSTQDSHASRCGHSERKDDTARPRSGSAVKSRAAAAIGSGGCVSPVVGGLFPVAQTSGPGKYPSSARQNTMWGTMPEDHWAEKSRSSSCQAVSQRPAAAHPRAIGPESQHHWKG